jgi:hypothetical protein
MYVDQARCTQWLASGRLAFGGSSGLQASTGAIVRPQIGMRVLGRTAAKFVGAAATPLPPSPDTSLFKSPSRAYNKPTTCLPHTYLGCAYHRLIARLSHAYHMLITRLSNAYHACHTPVTRRPHAYHMPITRLSHAYHTPITCLSHAYHRPITRLSQAYHMPITRLSHAYHTPITCLSHAYHTPITRLSHAYHMPITCPSHVYRTPITRLPHAYHMYHVSHAHLSGGSYVPSVTATLLCGFQCNWLACNLIFSSATMGPAKKEGKVR